MSLASDIANMAFTLGSERASQAAHDRAIHSRQCRAFASRLRGAIVDPALPNLRIIREVIDDLERQSA